MFSTDVQAAVRSLQEQCDVARASADSFELDRAERALDELVRNATRTGDPRRLIRSARANALKVVKFRAARVEFSLDEDLYGEKRASAEVRSSSDPIPVFEVLDWLNATPSLTDAQRDLLKALAQGYDAEDIAAQLGIQVARVRERISRARRAARAGYAAEVMCA